MRFHLYILELTIWICISTYEMVKSACSNISYILSAFKEVVMGCLNISVMLMTNTLECQSLLKTVQLLIFLFTSMCSVIHSSKTQHILMQKAVSNVIVYFSLTTFSENVTLASRTAHNISFRPTMNDGMVSTMMPFSHDYLRYFHIHYVLPNII